MNESPHVEAEPGSSSGRAVWRYVKYQALFLAVSAGMIGLLVLLSLVFGPEETREVLAESNWSGVVIDVLVVLFFFMCLFGSDLQLPIIIGWTALALVPACFVYLPDVLEGAVQPLVVLGFVLIELIALILTFQIKIWISEEEDVEPPM